MIQMIGQIETLRDVSMLRHRITHRNTTWVFQRGKCQRFHVRRNGRGEHQRLTMAVIGRLVNGFQLFSKTQIQHPVSFIHNQHFYPVQVDAALFQMVRQTTRCRDDDMWIFTQCTNLVVKVFAAQQQCGIEIFTCQQKTQLSINLTRQFAGWREDHRAWIALLTGTLTQQALHHRQQKRHGLTGAGLR